MSAPSAAALHRCIEAIKDDLAKLGPLRPGTLSAQYNVCGTPGCRCKNDPPEKHGPYYQLSYTWHRKSHTEFVRNQDLPELRQQLRNYQKLRALLDQWIDSAIELARLERQERRYPQDKRITKSLVSREKRRAAR